MEIKSNQKWKYGKTLLFSTAIIDIKSTGNWPVIAFEFDSN